MPDPGVQVSVVHEDADVVVVDKPAGLVVHPGAGHADRHARPRPARPLPGDGRASANPTGRASCTGSTATPPASSSSPGPRRRARRLVRALAERRVTREYLALVHGVPEADAGHGRRAGRPLLTGADADGGDGPGPGGADPLRGAAAVARARPVAAALPAGDGPHPPDPSAPGGHRPPRRRRCDLRPRPARRRAGAPACSCTPPASPSTTPSPASTSRLRLTRCPSGSAWTPCQA